MDSENIIIKVVALAIAEISGHDKFVIKCYSKREPDDKFDYSGYEYYGKQDFSSRNKLCPFLAKDEAIAALKG